MIFNNKRILEEVGKGEGAYEIDIIGTYFVDRNFLIF